MGGSLLFFSFLWWEIFHSLRKRSVVPIPAERIANFGDHLTFSSPSPTTFDDWQDKCATREEIHAVIDALVEVCRKYKSCGFDGMSFRCDRYLDANTNIRQDEYGGDVVDRGRFLLERFEKVKTKVGTNNKRICYIFRSFYITTNRILISASRAFSAWTAVICTTQTDL